MYQNTARIIKAMSDTITGKFWSVGRLLSVDYALRLTHAFAFCRNFIINIVFIPEITSSFIDEPAICIQFLFGFIFNPTSCFNSVTCWNSSQLSELTVQIWLNIWNVPVTFWSQRHSFWYLFIPDVNQGAIAFNLI